MADYTCFGLIVAFLVIAYGFYVIWCQPRGGR
jgi:hypothetical protein